MPNYFFLSLECAKSLRNREKYGKLQDNANCVSLIIIVYLPLCCVYDLPITYGTEFVIFLGVKGKKPNSFWVNFYARNYFLG